MRAAMVAGVSCVSRVTRIRGGAEFRVLEGTALCVAGGEKSLKRNQLCWPEASGAKGMRVANFRAAAAMQPPFCFLVAQAFLPVPAYKDRLSSDAWLGCDCVL
jgi:hypothetical protein